MTDPTPNPVPAAPGLSPGEATRAPRWMKVLLALSLAANLAVIGTVAGVALNARFGDGGPPERVTRDLAFGPFTEALTREQRRQYLRNVLSSGVDLRTIRDEMRSDLEAVLRVLRTSPFDAAAFRAAMEQQNARLTRRIAEGRIGLADLVAAMSDTERAEFADRLEQWLDRPPGGRRAPSGG